MWYFLINHKKRTLWLINSVSISPKRIRNIFVQFDICVYESFENNISEHLFYFCALYRIVKHDFSASY